MRIVRVATLLGFGGVEKRLVNIAESCPNGIETVFIALGGGGWASDELKKLGKKVYCLDTSFRIPNLFLIIRLVKLFKEIKPDVVHTSGAEANFHGQIAAYFARVPKRISEEIGFPKHNTVFKYIFKFIYKLSNAIICISEAVASKVVELGEASRDKIVVVYNPIAYKEYQINEKQVVDTNSLMFITVCRLTEIKNLERLLRVFKRFIITHPNSTLQLVGDGPEKVRLQILASKLGLKQNVVFYGFAQNPVDFLVKADVFILPSYSEGLGNAIMEAMLVGLPCIVSNVGGSKELIEEESNGWLIDPYNDDEILEKLIIACSTSAEVRKKMGLNNKERVKGKFSSAEHWQNLLNVYTK